MWRPKLLNVPEKAMLPFKVSESIKMIMREF